MTYRLLKVVCQVYLVSEDDTGNLIEHQANPVTVAAAEWPFFYDKFQASLKEMNDEIE